MNASNLPPHFRYVSPPARRTAGTLGSPDNPAAALATALPPRRRRRLVRLASAAVLAVGLAASPAGAVEPVAATAAGAGSAEEPTLRRAGDGAGSSAAFVTTDPGGRVEAMPDEAGAPAVARREPPPRAPRGGPAPRPGEPRALGARSTAAAGRAAGHVVVRFAPALAAGEEERIAAGAGGREVRRAAYGGFSRVAVPPGVAPEELAARLRGQPGVVWAEVDPLVRAATSRVSAAAVPPNDPLYPRQWHFHRIGLEEALDRNPTDGAGVIVAVVDSGVASGGGAAFPARTAPDLEGTIVLPGLDLIDGGPAWDEGTASDPDLPFRSPRFGHGTFVASVIAATIDNGFAGASVAPRVSILPVRVLGVDGFGTTSQVAEGIHFALREGAKVINLSLGATRGSSAMAEAVAAAHRGGAVVVAAAGNEAEEGLFDDELGRDVAFPARYAQAIAVGATGFHDQRAPYSNFGPSLDVVAPGGADNQIVAEGIRDGILATSFLHDPQTGETIYSAFFATGTSFAAPHVAGVAALLVSLGVNDPNAVRAMIEASARDLAEPGFDPATAHGLLDAAAAHRGIGFTF